MSVNGTSFTLGVLNEARACCEPTPQFEVKNLSVAYRGVKAIEAVSIDIPKGCITALIGPSGCGKTSFLSSLNRLTDLIPQANVQGDIVFEGASIYAKGTDVRALRSQVGMIFQKPNPFPLSIRKNLDMPLIEHGVADRKLREEKIEQALRAVGLWAEVCDKLDRSALELSGGQQQRLCIARALVLQPKVLLMDEPCSALDPIASGVVEDLITRLRGDYTIVIVTHNLAQAKRIANYVALFWVKERSGRLVEFGSKEALFENPVDALTAAYVSGARG